VIDVRVAALEDVPLLQGLVRELAVYEKLEHAMVSRDSDLAEALFGTHPAAEALVATSGGEAVGFAIYFTTYSTFVGRPGLYLEDLFVVPAARGQGAGRALLARLAAITVERNYGRLEWAVLDWNESAIGFYRKLGAAAMDEWTVFRLSGDALGALAARA
jgi:GNAT superfamily N-acetyltransferase